MRPAAPFANDSEDETEEIMKKVARISLAAILAGAIGAPASVPVPIPREVLPMAPAPARLPVEGEFPSLSGATAWLNSPPLTPAGLRGKVVLADIWTYTKDGHFAA
jgi:hypothetical protein